jgi:hypothetical protein
MLVFWVAAPFSILAAAIVSEKNISFVFRAEQAVLCSSRTQHGGAAYKKITVTTSNPTNIISPSYLRRPHCSVVWVKYTA